VILLSDFIYLNSLEDLMKKYFMGIVAFIMAMNFLFCVLGCKEAEVSPDVNAPTEVTELTATSNNGCLILS
jgi:hypothetical protein